MFLLHFASLSTTLHEPQAKPSKMASNYENFIITINCVEYVLFCFFDERARKTKTCEK